ncbi:hypothetical protein TWF694_007290 [Orbilia ellipsospora]|uniref:Beta-glucosidase n=1 Tax=Orbilia ellipsospora TaxID=2528407 RepID=A0AAV9XIR7_9PEZI
MAVQSLQFLSLAGLTLQLLAQGVDAQQVYILANSAAARPQCSSIPATPTYRFSSFSFTQTETYRYATSVPAPTTTKKYAPAYSSLSALLPSLETTTWGNWHPNDPAATDSANPYGRAAWSSLWQFANPTGFRTGIYSTTVAPTPLPSSELVLPPKDYFGPKDCYNFPSDFIFGVAGSASQIEGAAAMEGKGPNLLDIFSPFGKRSDNYVTNENYYLYKQDIERLASMGVKYYSFSVSWTRILPFALPGTPVNKAGIDHYNDLINFVISKGMIPTVTMIHFDTPLQFFAGNLTARYKRAGLGFFNGGYQNATFEDAMVNYGKILLTHYADRVPVWFTFNEPFLFSDNGHSVNSVIKAHGRLAHFYKDTIKGTGKIGLKLHDNFGIPLNPANSSDVAAANHFNTLHLNTFWNPLVLGIDYPDSFKKTAHDYVPLTKSDLEYLKNTCDFVAVDPYTITVVSAPPQGIDDCAKKSDPNSPYYPYCVTQQEYNKFGWNIGYRSQSYVYITPEYLRTYLNYLWNTFRKPVLISEFGFPVFGEALKEPRDQVFDTPRSLYYQSFLSETLKAIWEDGVHMMGALAWSFADNWEFGDYDQRFGLQTVDRDTQKRSFKKSFFDLVSFVRDRHPNYESS